MKIEFFYKDTGEDVKNKKSLIITYTGDVYRSYIGYSERGFEGIQFEKRTDICWRVVED